MSEPIYLPIGGPMFRLRACDDSPKILVQCACGKKFDVALPTAEIECPACQASANGEVLTLEKVHDLVFGGAA